MYTLFSVLVTACQATALSPELQAGVQGAMLLSAALPEHGPTPTPELKNKMAKAGSVVYTAYQLLQNAEGSVEEAQEKARTGTRLQGAASNLATGEMTLRRASALLQDGKRMKNLVTSSFQNSADPLGAPPEAPHSWDATDAMVRRASAKEHALHERITDMKSSLRRAGVSLMSVASEKTEKLSGGDPVMDKEEDAMVAFLSKY